MTTPTAQVGNKPSAANQFLVKVSGPGLNIKGFFATKTGGAPSVTGTRVYDGGAKDADVITSRTAYSDLTVGRPYRPTRDAPMLSNARRKLRRDCTVTVTATDTDGVPIPGTEDVYRCILSSATPPDVDSGQDASAANAQLTFIVKSMA